MIDRELLRLHIEAVWDLTLQPLDEASPEIVLTESIPPWSLYLGIFTGDQVALWNPEVAPVQRSLILGQALQAGIAWDKSLGMRREVVFHPPVSSLKDQTQAQQLVRLLNIDDADLVNAFEPASASYYLRSSCGPCVGVVIEGRLVSVAHSSRQTLSVCELGISTLPEARRQGYGRAATTLWTALVQRQGLVPMYSAFAWNAASLHLAQSVGYTPAINGVYGPVPQDDE